MHLDLMTLRAKFATGAEPAAAAAFASAVDVLSLMRAFGLVFRSQLFFAECLAAANFIYGPSFCQILFDALDNGAQRRTFIFDVS